MIQTLGHWPVVGTHTEASKVGYRFALSDTWNILKKYVVEEISAEGKVFKGAQYRVRIRKLNGQGMHLVCSPRNKCVRKFQKIAIL